MAATMWLVPSTRGSPVALRSMLGPRALTTASAPATARSMAAASVISPVTTVTSCPPAGRDLAGAAHVGGDRVPAGAQLFDDLLADGAGGAEDGDVHLG